MGVHVTEEIEQRGRGESGFTLVELMVVVLIIGILIAIVLGTYLGARERASDRAIQANLRTGLAVAISFYDEDTTYTGLDAVQATKEEPTIQWVAGVVPASNQIDIEVAAGDNLLMVGQSASGRFFCIAEIPGSPVTERGQGAAFTDVDTIAECVNGW
jgi:type IV pilus assembly protein PilA